MTAAIRLAKAIRLDHASMMTGNIDRLPVNAAAARKRIVGYRADAAGLDADHLAMLNALEQHFNLSLTSEESADMATVTITAESVRTAARAKGIEALADRLEANGMAPADAMAIIAASPAAAAPVEKKHAFSQPAVAAASASSEPVAAAPAAAEPAEGVRADAVATARQMYGAKS